VAKPKTPFREPPELRPVAGPGFIAHSATDAEGKTLITISSARGEHDLIGLRETMPAGARPAPHEHTVIAQ